MSWRKAIRFHLRFYEMTYKAVAFAFLLPLVLALVFGGIEQGKQRAIARVHDWPKTTGTVLDARIVSRDASDEHSLDMEISATGHLRYPHPAGERAVAFHAGIGGKFPYDWQGTFKPGGQISIRYNPENPEEISLIDFTGIP